MCGDTHAATLDILKPPQVYPTLTGKFGASIDRHFDAINNKKDKILSLILPEDDKFTVQTSETPPQKPV